MNRACPECPGEVAGGAQGKRARPSPLPVRRFTAPEAASSCDASRVRPAEGGEVPEALDVLRAASGHPRGFSPSRLSAHLPQLPIVRFCNALLKAG
jgi:hypothetical protein